MRMTKRERALTVLAGGRPDKLPWFGDLTYWKSYLEATGSLDGRYKGPDGTHRLNEDMGVGFYLQGFFPFKTHVESVDVKAGDRGGARVTSYSTPYGTLTEASRHLPGSYTSAPIEHMVKGPGDLRALRHIYENTHYEPLPSDFAAIGGSIGSNGVTLCYVPKSPFMELLVYKAGVEATAYLAEDCPEELGHTLEVIAGRHGEASAITLASACECVMMPENFSSDCVGAESYDRYVGPYHREWSRKIEDRGKHSFIHVDGAVRGLLGRLCGSGFKVLEALTTQPVGDVGVGELTVAAPSGTVIWGCLPGALFGPSFPEGEFRSYCVGAIKALAGRPGCVLGVADQVPPYADADRVRMVDGLVEEYGAITW